MDPWYYNRLSNASAKFQSGSGTSPSEYHQQLAGHQSTASGSPATSTPQLLLQAAQNQGHSIPPPFNPGFLTPNPYDFSLFSNASQYAAVSQHRALASAISTSKPAAESESSLRENYSPAHHSSLATASSGSFFDHQNSPSSSLAWSHQPNSQLPSPFGVLPHESVSNSSVDPPSKAASTEYGFNAYPPSHSLNHLSQLPDYKHFSDTKKEIRSQSPATSTKVSSASPSSVPYYQGTSITGNSYSSSESNIRSSFSSSSKYSGNAAVQPQQSCIVASPSATPPSKDYGQHHSAPRVEDSAVYPDLNSGRNKQSTSRSQNFVPSSTKSSPVPVPTKAQAKVYSDVAIPTETSHRSKIPLDASQSSPISLSMMDSRTSHRFVSESNVASKQAPINPSQRASGSQQPYLQSLNHQPAAYYAHPTATHEADYHRSKSVESVFNPASIQNGSECTTRRASPLTSHPQASPLGHVHSPAYPIYNNSSPMSSMPSPSPHQLSESANPCQNSSSSYKTAAQVSNSTAPLDAPLLRPQGGQAQSGSYPSVITRALAIPEPAAKSPAYTETRAYDLDQSRYSKQWDSGSDRSSTATQQQRKSQSASSASVYNAHAQEMAANITHQQHPLRTAERQQSYYDSAPNQASQDLSSFRGDPMSIVKNLQSLQQPTYAAQPTTEDSRLLSKTPGTNNISPNSSGKRRKSSEKQVTAPNSIEYYNNRIPPPAHVTSQQQQNGSFFPNYLSPPSNSRAYSGSQTPLHHVSNSFMGSQSQGLYMSPYFSPFHLPQSAQSTGNADYQSSSSHSRAIYPACDPNSQQVSSVPVQAHVPETPVVETPKVVVPDIEKELNHLVGPVLMLKSERGKKNTSASAFEASYLKFLQGERESSPPPSNRGSQKTWYKSKSCRNEPSRSVTSSNESNIASNAAERCDAAKEEPADYDVEDDPRYFPLPKTDAQRKSLESSDSDSDSDQGTASKNQTVKTQDRKPIAAVAPRTANKQGTKGAAAFNPQPAKRGRKKKSEVSVPRRETSRRKAKEKGSILLNADDPEEPYGDSDSDSDPAWTPVPFKSKSQNVESSEDENVKKKSPKKATKLSGTGRKRSKHAISDDDQTSEDETSKSQKQGSKHRKKFPNQSVGTGPLKSGADGEDPDLFSFKIGEFVVMKSDLSLKWPPLWRVDGKTLLQKYEPFDLKGEMLYRNISTYSGWTPQNRDIYKPVQVKFRVKGKKETIVQFIRKDFVENDDGTLDSLMKTTAHFQENFEVYIQTLISQALDSNFLTEIFQERDEYFLTNVKIVDDIVFDRRQRFLHIVKWRTELEASIATWPCYNVMFELVGEESCKNCAACDKSGVAARVLLYGQPYNSTTLEGCQADPKLVSEKDFLTCRACLSRIELYNKVAHQKYLMFIECAKRVQEKRLADSSKDSTVILNQLLADDAWLHQLFRNVRLCWAEIDRLEKLSLKG